MYEVWYVYELKDSFYEFIHCENIKFSYFLNCLCVFIFLTTKLNSRTFETFYVFCAFKLKQKRKRTNFTPWKVISKTFLYICTYEVTSVIVYFKNRNSEVYWKKNHWNPFIQIQLCAFLWSFRTHAVNFYCQ